MFKSSPVPGSNPAGKGGRRLLALVLGCILVFFAGVPFAGWPVQLPRPGVTLVLWDGPRWADESGNRYHWVETKIAEFEAAHPFVEVVLVPTDWGNLRAALDSAKEAGRLPDVAPFDLSAGGITPAEIKAGLLEPVDNYISSPDDISPEARAAFTYDGHLWGFPSTMTGQVLLLNLDLFAERGVSPPADGKWTWDEFRAACKKLTFDADGDGKVDHWGFATYILPGYYEAWPFLYSGGARPLSNDLTTYTFNSTEGVAALQRLTDLVFVDKVAHPMTGTASVRSIFDLFAVKDKQVVAIEPWSPWAIDYLETQEGVIKNFAVAEFPTPPGAPPSSSAAPSAATPAAGGGTSAATTAAPAASASATSTPVTVGGTSGFVVFRQSDPTKRALAMELADYLTNAKAQYELARGYRAFPSRRRALDLDPFAGAPVYQKAAEIIFHAVSLPPAADWPDLDRVIQREVQMALLGVKSPKAALDDAGAQVTTLLEEAAKKADTAHEGGATGSRAAGGTAGPTGAMPGEG